MGDHLSGVGVYSREILHGLAAAHGKQPFLWCYRPHRMLRALRQSQPVNCGRRLIFESHLPACSLFHGLNQRLPLAKARRMVVTFHDLFVMTGEYSTPEFRERFAEQARRAAERADLIICVSAFTASQVAELLHVEPSRLRVVWHGVRPLAVTPPNDAAREDIILHVGAIQARKNILRLVEAFERMPAPWRLVLAGDSGYGAEQIMARIERSPARARIEITGYVTDAQLESWYCRARMLAFPSLDEGFGIPLLEAMAYQLPIVTSNRSALREVGTGAAVLVDPENVDEISDALLRLGADEELRTTLRQAGSIVAAKHSWQYAAEQTWGVYRELV